MLQTLRLWTGPDATNVRFVGSNPTGGSIDQLYERSALCVPSHRRLMRLENVPPNGGIAQWLEQEAFNLEVQGSSPCAPTNIDAKPFAFKMAGWHRIRKHQESELGTKWVMTLNVVKLSRNKKISATTVAFTSGEENHFLLKLTTSTVIIRTMIDVI